MQKEQPNEPAKPPRELVVVKIMMRVMVMVMIMETEITVRVKIMTARTTKVRGRKITSNLSCKHWQADRALKWPKIFSQA